MRRADRLFEIIQLMRRKPTVRARDLSEALEVSERTIYRDIRDLMASGVPIEGEAGVGYVLRAGFDLPPLMFKEARSRRWCSGRASSRVLGRQGAGRGGERRHRQDRGGDPGTAARLYGQHRAARAADAFHGADRLRSRRSAAGGARPDQGAFRATSTCWRGRASGRCGRCRWPISARCGCWRPGASCGRISAPSGWTGSRGSRCAGAFPAGAGQDAARLPQADRHLDARRAEPERAG